MVKILLLKKQKEEKVHLLDVQNMSKKMLKIQ